jgi:multiple sugar transport system permease protein/multiple sugar transport system substrate-binding protein
MRIGREWSASIMIRLTRDFVASNRLLITVVLALAVAFALYPRLDRVERRSGVTEILLWTPVEAGDAVRVAVEEFERRNPRYKVLMGAASVRDATSDPTRFLLSVAGGSPPDLIQFDRFAVVEWASRGAFEDLTPFVAADRDRPEGIRPENFYRPPWEEGIYQGKVYAIPISVDTRGLYFNRDALIRAGFVYRPGDREVIAGTAEAGQAKPPRTWEQLCRKLVHANGRVTAQGVVRLDGWTRRSAVNQDMPKDRPVDVTAYGVRPGDVIALVRGTEVFRGRVAEVLSPNTVRIDMRREQPPGLTAIPNAFTGGVCQVKLFDQDSYTARLTYYNPKTGTLQTAGFIPLFANSWLYMFGWLNGGQFMSGDGLQCQLDSPEIVEALQFMTDAYDAIGGMKVAQAFTANISSGPMDPFLIGKVSMRMDSDGYLKLISAYAPRLSFGAVGAPIPQERLDAGHKPVGWMGGWSYAIPSTARHKQAAWDLLRWMSSAEANRLMTRFEASLARAQGQTYFPYSHPDRRVMKWLQQEYVQNNPAVSDDMRRAHRVFVDLLPTSKYRPVTPIGQLLWSEQIRAMEAAIRHVNLPYDALNYGKRRAQAALDRFMNPPTGPAVPWARLIGGYVLGVLVTFAGVIGYREFRTRRQGLKHRHWLDGYICASPWLIGFIVLGAGPIVFSLVISFCRYDVLNPAVFVGLGNYTNALGFHYDDVVQRRVPNDPLLWRSLWNTAYMVIGVPLVIVVGLAMAMLLNTKAKALPLFRTVFYLPVIVPAVAGFILWIWVFDPVTGLLNRALVFLGVTDPPQWLHDPAWAKPALILMALWAAGGGMIIWLAGLKEIPGSLYEAAQIDGANRVQQFRHVTMPLLTPYIFFNFLMGMIGVFQTFESAYIMTDGGPADATLFYAYKLFNESFRYLNMGLASAMAWILFVVVLSVTLFQMWLSKKWVHYER